MTKMYVYSLDYDGCMADQSIEKMIQGNSALIDEILAHIEKGHEVTLCVGSNRQGISKDHLNSKPNPGYKKIGSPSVFAAYPALVNHIKERLPDHLKSKITFNNFLLTDAHQGVAPGTNYDSYQQISYIKQGVIPTENDLAIDGALRESLEKDKITKTDESKISTLYAQMHHIACLNPPHEQIEFIFKDDRKDILAGLHQFYSKNPNFIPKNLTLKLEQKISTEAKEAIDEKKLSGSSENEAWNIIIGGKIDNLTPITGTGILDNDYAKTSTSMLVIATQIASESDKSIKKPLEGFFTPKTIFNYPKIALEEIRGISNNATSGFLKPRFLEIFDEYKDAQEDAALEEEISKRMNPHFPKEIVPRFSPEVQYSSISKFHAVASSPR